MESASLAAIVRRSLLITVKTREPESRIGNNGLPIDSNPINEMHPRTEINTQSFGSMQYVNQHLKRKDYTFSWEASSELNAIFLSQDAFTLRENVLMVSVPATGKQR